VGSELLNGEEFVKRGQCKGRKVIVFLKGNNSDIRKQSSTFQADNEQRKDTVQNKGTFSVLPTIL
jgi:hypothetical protein